MSGGNNGSIIRENKYLVQEIKYLVQGDQYHYPESLQKPLREEIGH